ncbi:MAG: AI-2E family transporter [Pseudomonadales bacterium]
MTSETDSASTSTKPLTPDALMEVFVRAGIIVVLVVLSFRVFSPFMGVLLWGAILAVALYPLHLKFMRWTGGRQGLAASLLVGIGLLLVGGPVVLLGGLFAEFIQATYHSVVAGTVSVNPPAASVADWPVVGERVYAAWSAAATDLPAFIESLQPQIGKLTAQALSMASATMGAVLVFLAALIISGIMMAYGESGSAAFGRIMARLSGAENGPRLHRLTTATIRSVAVGVVGVAFIQAILLGLGFAFSGVPAAGILAVLVLLIGILQLPALLLSLPAVGYLWWAGEGSTVMTIVWTIYLLVAGMADNVLKPLLLGRGVDVPMPVVLIGALGGMVYSGIVGLFIGAVILAVGYQLFMDWVDRASPTTPVPPPEGSSPAP